MTLDEIERLALTCSGWDWRPGMRGVFTLDGDPAWFRVFWDDHRDRLGVFAPWLCTPHVLSYFLKLYPDARPDLSDPATVGCLRSIIGELNEHGCYSVPPAFFYVRRDVPLRALAEVLVSELTSFDDSIATWTPPAHLEETDR